MKAEKQYSGALDATNIKPFIDDKGLFFPVEVSCVDTSKYDGDARSFGYQVDSGFVTIVAFERAVGVLADDTVSAFHTNREIRVDKPDFLEYFDYCQDDIEESELEKAQKQGKIIFDSYRQKIYSYNDQLFVDAKHGGYPIFEKLIHDKSRSSDPDEAMQMLCNDRDMALEDTKRKNELTKLVAKNIKALKDVYPLKTMEER